MSSAILELHGTRADALASAVFRLMRATRWELRRTRSGLLPINGLRHAPSGDTSGWYIWAGEELATSDDFFSPLHVEHLDEWCPAVKKYLGLPPGWRFLIAKNYEDVWFDESLLNG